MKECDVCCGMGRYPIINRMGQQLYEIRCPECFGTGEDDGTSAGLIRENNSSQPARPGKEPSVKLPKAKRVFTREQWLKRDIRSAATRSKAKGIKPTLPKLKCLEAKD